MAPPPHFRPRPRPFRSRPPMLPAHGAAPQWPRALLLGARRCAVRAALCGAGAALLLWAAAFAYGGFYFLTVPAAGLVAPVHFRFRTDCAPRGAELCSFPTANVSLLGPERQRALSPGQLYRVALELEVPESPSNRRLGMFLVGLTWHTQGGREGASSTRTAMLRYRSAVLRALEALLLSGLFLVGAAEQKQLLEVELSDAYREDPYAPTVAALLEIRSRRIEIYSARLRLHAKFSGIRYLLYHFPVTSAILGIATNFTFMAAIALLSCVRGRGQSQPRAVPTYHRVPDPGATPAPTGEAEDIGVTEGDEEGTKGAEPEEDPKAVGLPQSPDDVTADVDDDVTDDVTADITTGATGVTAVPTSLRLRSTCSHS